MSLLNHPLVKLDVVGLILIYTKSPGSVRGPSTAKAMQKGPSVNKNQTHFSCLTSLAL